MLSSPVRPPALEPLHPASHPAGPPFPGPFAPVVDDRGHFETEGNP